MKPLFDAFWRAALYCLHPRVIALSLLPLLLLVGAAYGLAYFFWEGTVDAVRLAMEGNPYVSRALGWLENWGVPSVRQVLAPLLVVLVATPVVIMASLLMVASMLTPAAVSLVAERRFVHLERKSGGSVTGGLLLALITMVVAVVLLVVSSPLWLIPPLVLLLPPLIWGWLTYRVLTYDVLAAHASKDERKTLMQRHRGPLLAMGVITGYLGALPSLLWASGAMFIAMAPLLVPAAIWIYNLVFAFASLWYAHFALNALSALRLESMGISPSQEQLRQIPADPNVHDVDVRELKVIEGPKAAPAPSPLTEVSASSSPWGPPPPPPFPFVPPSPPTS